MNDKQHLEGQCERIFTTIGDRRIVWRLWGEGPLRVMLHGGSGSWTHWIRNIGPLSTRERLLIPDLPGCGDSDLPSHPFTRDDLVGSTATLASDLHVGLTQILQGLDIDHYRLTGFSLGSIVGTYVASIDPDRCRELVLVGASAFGEPMPPVPDDVEPLNDSDTQAEALARQGRNLKRIMLSNDSAIDEFAAWLQYDNVTRARLRTHWLARSDTLSVRLGDVRAPVTAIWGDADRYVLPSLDGRIASLMALQPDAAVFRIPGAGHWAMFEAAERFNEIMLENTG